MQRLSLADLFLDTHPYNAGASASDALWAGLPVLTRPGRSYASRMAASLLHAVGLPEMVVPSDAKYVEQAVHLATAPHTLKAMAQCLAATRRTAALFDTQSFTRTLEAAYATIHQRARERVPPGPVTILQETLA
jgi:predicted O-linked N-acetylglucosamine transferase (SPINDLY family)